MHKTKTGKKMRLLGMDTCPSLNDIMEIILDHLFVNGLNYSIQKPKVVL